MGRPVGGRIIPRDKALLHRMYWVDKINLSEMGEAFGVDRCSVGVVFKKLGIPTLGKGKRWPKRECRNCGGPVKLVKHATNGSLYGTLCAVCRKEHRGGMAREYNNRPEVKRKRKELLKRWYVVGPIQPKEEKQWLVKGKHLLRTARRILANPSPAASQYQKAVSGAEASSQISCPASSPTSLPAESRRKSATRPAMPEGSS